MPPVTAVAARPTFTCPPPAVPVAVVVDFLVMVMSLATKLIWPPVLFCEVLLASTVPACVTVLATSSITPPLFTAEEAEILPVFFTTELIN